MTLPFPPIPPRRRPTGGDGCFLFSFAVIALLNIAFWGFIVWAIYSLVQAVQAS